MYKSRLNAKHGGYAVGDMVCIGNQVIASWNLTVSTEEEILTKQWHEQYKIITVISDRKKFQLLSTERGLTQLGKSGKSAWNKINLS